MQLILASSSPRRQNFLKELGVDFLVMSPRVQELEDAPPQYLVRHNATLKAEHVAKLYPESFVLGADTTVALGEKVFNKPKNMEEAFQMLHLLSGKTHSVYTAVSLINKAKKINDIASVESFVTFSPLTDSMIKIYYEKVNPLDKAGGYAIQDGLGTIIKSYEGSLSNIIGLPMEHVKNLFKRYQIPTI